MTEVNPPVYLQGGCYESAQDREMLGAIICVEGIAAPGGELLVTSIPGDTDVSVAPGRAWVEGDLNGSSGMYFVTNDGDVPLTVNSNSDPVNDRVDLVIATVYDQQYIGSSSVWVLEVIQGIPGGGVPVVPDDDRVGWVLLAQVTVPANNVVPSVVSDQRVVAQFCSGGLSLHSDIQVFDTPGVHAWAKPSGAKVIKVRAIGGGGGGGSARATSGGESSFGSGGGGGGYAEIFRDAEDFDDMVYLTVGAGGAGGVGSSGGGTTGDTGVDSIFRTTASSGSAITCRAGGGPGGTAAAATSSLGGQTPPGGGSGITGDVLSKGGTGGGGLRIDATEAISGAGGDTALGAGGASRPNSSTGANGNTGGGGSGAVNAASAGSKAGGDGGTGVIIVETWF